MLKKITESCLIECTKYYGQNRGTPCIDLLYELINNDSNLSKKEYGKLLSLLTTTRVLYNITENNYLDNFKYELFKKYFLNIFIHSIN
jgi:hypothetical protein